MSDQMALEVLRSYPSNTIVSELYDHDEALRNALGDLFPSSFEYPDFSHRKIGEIVKSLAKSSLSTEAVTQMLNDRYAESIIGDDGSGYDAFELHGVRDVNELNDPTGTQCEIDEENPQFYSVYAHLRDGGVDCVGDFSEHKTATAYAVELSQQYHYPVLDYSKEGKQLREDLAISKAHAEKIAQQKAGFTHVDPSVNQTYVGKVMDIADHHLVLSVGRNAAIFEKSMINGVEAIKSDSEIAVAVQGGKARVVPEKEKASGISR